jgi:uracil-DNA glycosylase
MGNPDQGGGKGPGTDAAAMTLPGLESLYERNGVRLADGATPDLFAACADRDACWKGTTPPASGVCRIHHPYIGASYHAHRLAVVGQNLYDFGGWDALAGLFSQAIPALAAGRVRMSFGNPRYKGTLVYHRAAVYARVLIAGRLPDDLFTNHQALAEASRGFAFLNAVKCSPAGDRSAPVNDMPARCIRRFLEAELTILAPTTVLCLYRAAFVRLMAAHGVAGNRDQEGDCRRGDLDLNGQRMACLYVPHPAAARGGARKSLAADLHALMARARPHS